MFDHERFHRVAVCYVEQAIIECVDDDDNLAAPDETPESPAGLWATGLVHQLPEMHGQDELPDP